MKKEIDKKDPEITIVDYQEVTRTLANGSC